MLNYYTICVFINSKMCIMSRNFSNITNILMNDNFKNNKKEETKKRHDSSKSDRKKNIFDFKEPSKFSKVEEEGEKGKVREIKQDSELGRLLQEPIKKVVARIKTKENGVLYVDFEEVVESRETKMDSTCSNENNLQASANSKDESFENIKILEPCTDLDSIDITDCLFFNSDFKIV